MKNEQSEKQNFQLLIDMLEKVSYISKGSYIVVFWLMMFDVGLNVFCVLHKQLGRQSFGRPLIFSFVLDACKTKFARLLSK